jgi:hypothetical protein
MDDEKTNALEIGRFLGRPERTYDFSQKHC